VRPISLLLLGPTGSGKTPLGALWQRTGLCGRPCFHFDFGAELRAAAGPAGRLDQAAPETVRRVLAAGALLEDSQFSIADRILAAFIRERGPGQEGLLILNGLPRHAGQARDMAARVDVRAVIRLQAALDVLLARIRGDVGGDRAGRSDDGGAEVAERLRLYEERTSVLAAHYRALGVPVLVLEVGPGMTSRQAAARLEPELAAVPVLAAIR